MARITANMTMTSALDIVLHKSAAKPELKAFIQTSMGAKKNNLRSGQLTSSESTGKYDGLTKAKNMLNEMIEESQTKYDLEIEKCCQYDAYQSAVMEQARQDIAKFNAEAAEARACIEEMNGIIELCERELPTLTEMLEAHNAECAANIGELKRILKIVIEDISIMDDILKIIGTCPDEGSTAAAGASSSFFVQRCIAQGEDGGEDEDSDGCIAQGEDG